MKARLSIMLFISLALHGWLLWAAPAPEMKAPGGAVALKLGQLRLAASHMAAVAPTESALAEPASHAVPEKQQPSEKPKAHKPRQNVVKNQKTAQKQPRKEQPPKSTRPVPPASESVPEADVDPPSDSQSSPAASARQNTQLSVSDEPVLVERPAFASPPAAPAYPELARQRRQQGTVVVEVQLDRNGAQVMRSLLQSSGIDSLDEAALTAVKNWEFLPYRENGRTRLSRVRLPIRFSL